MSKPFKTNSLLVNSSDTVPPVSGTWNTNTILADSDGNLWICVKGGNPGLWTVFATQKSINEGEINFLQNVGLVKLPNYSVNGNKITISDVICNIYTNDSDGKIVQIFIPEERSFALTEIDDYFIVVSMVNNNPVLELRTMRNSTNFITDVPIARLCWDGSNIKYDFYENLGLGALSKLLRKDLEVFNNLIVSGFSISESTGRVIAISSGVAYHLTKRYMLDRLSSDTDPCLFFFHNNEGNWTYNVVNSYNNIHYDTGNGLEEINDNEYAVNWLFRSTISNTMVYILGRNSYTLDMALASGLPPIPPPVETMCVFVGRIIVKKGMDTAELIQQAKNIFFGYSPTYKHNDLGGIQGGLPAEHYHLSENQYDVLTNKGDASPLHTHTTFEEVTVNSLQTSQINVNYTEYTIDSTYTYIKIVDRNIDILPIPYGCFYPINRAFGNYDYNFVKEVYINNEKIYNWKELSASEKDGIATSGNGAFAGFAHAIRLTNNTFVQSNDIIRMVLVKRILNNIKVEGVRISPRSDKDIYAGQELHNHIGYANPSKMGQPSDRKPNNAVFWTFPQNNRFWIILYKLNRTRSGRIRRALSQGRVWRPYRVVNSMDGYLDIIGFSESQLDYGYLTKFKLGIFDIETGAISNLSDETLVFSRLPSQLPTITLK